MNGVVTKIYRESWCLCIITNDTTVIFNIKLSNFLICIERISETIIKTRQSGCTFGQRKWLNLTNLSWKNNLHGGTRSQMVNIGSSIGCSCSEKPNETRVKHDTDRFSPKIGSIYRDICPVVAYLYFFDFGDLTTRMWYWKIHGLMSLLRTQRAVL